MKPDSRILRLDLIPDARAALTLFFFLVTHCSLFIAYRADTALWVRKQWFERVLLDLEPRWTITPADSLMARGVDLPPLRRDGDDAQHVLLWIHRPSPKRPTAADHDRARGAGVIYRLFWALRYDTTSTSVGTSSSPIVTRESRSLIRAVTSQTHRECSTPSFGPLGVATLPTAVPKHK